MWILVDVGCIECGEKSTVIGFFESREKADVYWETQYLESGTPWGRASWGGQHHSLIQEVSDIRHTIFLKEAS